MNTVYICSSCGSKKIQSKAWVDLNEGVMPEIDFIGTDDSSNNWCEDCQDHVLVEEEINKQN